MQIVEYRWAKGSRYPDEKAEPTGKALDTLRKKKGGALLAQDVVKAARSARSPLHWAFEWDDNAAAEEYRLWEARRLMGAIHVIVKDTKTKKRYETRHLQVAQKRGGKHEGRNAYHSISDIMKDPELRADLLARAHQELLTWEKRYQQLTELSVVFKAIKKLKL